MNDQGLGITNISKMTKKLCALNKTNTRRLPTPNTERDNAAGAARQVFAGQFVVRTIWQPSVPNPRDIRVLRQKLRNSQRVAAMPFHP